MIESGFSHLPGIQLTFGAMSSAEALKADLVVPLSVEDSHALARMGCEQHAGLCLSPSGHLIDLAHNKQAFNRRLCELGFHDLVPEMFEGAARFPYVLKKSEDEASVSTCVVRSVEDEAKHQEALADPAFFRQAFIPGNTEYATHMLMHGGRLIHDLSVKYVYDNAHPIKGRAGCYSRIVETPCLDELTLILTRLGYNGVCCFNYKLSDAGRPMIIELNPRFGGSLCRHFPRFVRAMEASGLLSDNARPDSSTKSVSLA